VTETVAITYQQSGRLWHHTVSFREALEELRAALVSGVEVELADNGMQVLKRVSSVTVEVSE
jgi:hypothetical protein